MFNTQIPPDQTLATLSKYMLVDGYSFVVDLEKSQGAWLVDARTGHRFVDFFTGVSSMPLGFNHPKMVTDDVVRRLGRIAVNKPANADAYTPEMASFVETFFRVAVPEYFRYAFFIEGGALAVENAIKAAVDWKVQKNFQKGVSKERYPDGLGKQVIHFKESFHGRSGYTVSLTDSADPNKTRYFAKFEWPRIVNPKITFPLEGQRLEAVIAKEKEAIGQIEEALRRNPDLACLVVEPIQGEGGDNHFRTEFFQELRRLADSHEFLLVFDEVQTGLGLTGRMWAHQHHGVNPDLMSFGKKTQVCGILAGPRLDEIESNVFHVPSRINSTWGGNLLDMVRCQLYLEIYEEENLVQQAATTGEHLLGRLHEMASEFEGIIENVRGKGLFCAFDLTDRIDRKALIRAAYEEGLIILPSGRKGLRFRPPLSIEIPVLEEGLNRLQTALRRVLG
ncbi:MAG: L-lysine 6-transaminase [Candidatus Eisenbacteria bacterium]|uniref:L-lysine-epsilon aminotransferase n=1 Tax=Eiseniibacteriota bacterium TaxID=2212470 RepID=A0A956RP04_UNCEI|nr:L-lysine 6-transaminase [Candidatus Eisenbacteria bacterium]